jgi:urease alpha subunit
LRFQVTLMQEIKLAQDQSREIQSETRAIALAQGANTHLHLNRIALESQAHSTHMTMLEQYATERRDTSKATAVRLARCL